MFNQQQPAETFSDVAPISSAETFSDVTPIAAPKTAAPAGDTFAERLRNANNPGVSEGAGLREGLAEWDEKSGGEIFGGLHDLLRGDISKGMHRIFSGAGNAAAPVAALTAPAMIMAPATTLGAAAGGVLAGKATKAAADAIGATPDQAQVAEDVANLAGGIGGAKLAGALTDTVLAQRIARVAGKTAADALTDVPVVRQLLKFKANWEATAVPKPVYPGAPLPEHPGVFPGAPLPEHPGVFPGAPLPATPAPEVLNPALTSEARTMPGAHSPEVVRPVAAPVKPAAPLPARSGLQLPGEVAAPAAAAPRNTIPAAPKVTPAAKLEDQLTDALGGSKPNVQPGKPIAQRPAAAAAKPADVPAGFTPVENSSVVKGYKYDPATKEFEAITHTGQRYRAGEVTADQVAKFEATDSKGAAWNELRKNSTPLGKFVAGKFEPYTKPGLRSADPNAEAESGPMTKAVPKTLKSLSGDEDLTGKLQASLDQAKAKAPRYVYRARDVGEEGVPLKQSHAQAGTDRARIQKYAEAGQRNASEAGEVIRVDLSKLKPSDYILKSDPNGTGKWVQFTRPLSENEVEVLTGKSAAAKQDISTFKSKR
jgi:hypothetical protein